MNTSKNIKEDIITAYHGSPYEFDIFDMSKIGSGDGLNKYGYGLYFADREDTAEYYAKELTLNKHKETGLNLYDVNLNGDFYQWDNEIPQHIHECVINKLREIDKNNDADEMQREAEEYGDLWSMDSLYQWLDYVVGGGKNTSKFLVQCGVDGVIAQSPAHEGNVIVVYNDESIRIVNRRKMGEDLDEMIRREIWTMNENPQQMDKKYISKGLFTDQDRENVMSITNGDPYTKTISDLYAWIQQIEPYKREHGTRNDDDYERYFKKELEKIHNALKTYNKNVFPIENFDPANTQEHPIDVWSAIKRRIELIDFFNQIPSTYLRNLKGEIRKPIPINHYEYYLKNEVQELKGFFNKVNQLSDDKRDIMMKKIFSSNNKTFGDVIQQANNSDVLYLSSDDAEEEVRDKVSALEGEADVLYDQNNVMVVDIKSSDAMKMLGCGSQWCFSTEGGDHHWENYADNGHVNLIYNFEEDSDSRKRMVVLLPDGGLYDMYNDYLDDYSYLDSIGVDQYLNVGHDEMVESLTNKIMNEMTENQGFLAFHGSPTEINKFTDEFVGAEEATDQEGAGIYFTTSFEDAEGYAERNGYVYTVRLNTRKLLDESPASNVDPETLVTLIQQAEDWESLAQNFSEDPYAGAMSAAHSAIEYNETEKDAFVQIWVDFFRYDSVGYVRAMTKMGYDGIVIKKEGGQSHIIIYNPAVIEVKDVERINNLNETLFQMQNFLDNAAEDGHIKDGGYAGNAFLPSNELDGDDLNENFYENYRDITLPELKKSTDFIEANGNVYKPTGEMISKLFKNYLIGSQNIENSLKISNDNVKFFNNLMKIQKFFKGIGLIKEDLVYWGANDTSPDSDEYKVGAQINEEEINEVGDVTGINKEDADNIAAYVAQKNNLKPPKYIGEGMFGYAYDAGNVVIKITKDQSEAVDSLNIKGQKNERIADIYNVFHTDKKTNTSKGDIFVILLEKLDTSKGDIENTHMSLDKILKDNFEGEGIPSIIIDEYNYNRYIWDKETKKDIDYILKDHPREKEYLEELIAITDEVKAKGIDSTDFTNYNNLGYKKNGNLGFFDAGFGDYFKKPDEEFQKIKIGEDGTSLYTNTQGTVNSEDNSWDINEMILDVTANVITERITSWMPKSKAVTVKKECQLGGKGDGTSKACNQGDIDNLEIKEINDSNQHRRKANTINVAEDDVNDRHYFQDIDRKINETVDNLVNSHNINEDTNINQTNTLTVYHGTKPKFLNKIKQEGLVSPSGYNQGWYMVSTDYESALFHAHPDDDNGDVYVIEFKIPLVENSKWEGYPYLWSGEKMNDNSTWYALKEKIPSEFIRNVHKVDNSDWVNQKNNGFNSVTQESKNTYITSIINEGIMSREDLMKFRTIKEADIMNLEDLPFKDEIERLGGKIFSVGGAVRDKFLGKDSKDLDILITGIPMDKLERLLNKYGKVDAVGKSFGVIKFVPKGATDDIDIAIPRTEQKVGDGHKGFDVTSDHELPIEDDLKRRDFTINAIAKDVNGNLIDPYNGQEDLRNKIIRVVNPEAFADDPLRMLRAVQFASRFGFTIEPNTMDLIKQNAPKIKEIAGERMFIELEKIVTKGDKKVGAQLLKNTGLYENMFGVDLDQSIIDESPFDKVKTMGEYIYLLTRQLDNPAEVFKSMLKGDIPTFKEIEALSIGFDNASNNNVKNRVVAHNMFTKSPESINSQILPEKLKKTIVDLDSGLYPKSIKELAINGNDLMEKGLKGKEIGDTLKSLLINIYGDKIKNNRENLLDYLNNQEL